MEPFERLIVEMFGLKYRTYSILRRAGINNLGELLSTTEDELLAQTCSFMDREVEAIKDVLGIHGLRLRKRRKAAQQELVRG